MGNNNRDLGNLGAESGNFCADCVTLSIRWTSKSYRNMIFYIVFSNA